MSRTGRSLLLLLRSCSAVRQATLAAAAATLRGGGGGGGGGGFVLQAARAASTHGGFLRGVCPLLSAVRSSRLGLCTQVGGAQGDEYPPLPAYRAEPERQEVHIVQVKGLPWKCSAQDLIHFFSDCSIRGGLQGIHLTLDQWGRPSGQAFVELEHEEDVSRALEKHRQYLGNRYLEVYEVTDSAAESILKNTMAAAAAAAAPPVEQWVVRLRGLPFSCTHSDIVHFFSGLEIAENGITLVSDVRGRSTGDAFVSFRSQEAADGALQRDRQEIGHRYIEVYPSSAAEVHSTRGPRRPPASGPAHILPQDAVQPLQPLQPLQRVRMRGLPFQTSGVDIVKFFSPLPVSKILMECGADGRPSGEADVFFSSHQDAIAAMSRDRLYIGERYVELYLNSDGR